ncbi:hypothetical protein BpHYR1_054220 [Brachionus plicatilis]|uniref:Uncharacterized protein n=1 Tax=Brachionus plicatilis TaxID=10195 RepID=A0A3M7PYP0_BRAPC|nr:hypothetical protein BpHYR1_054220 [Brachionus plicatilis]
MISFSKNVIKHQLLPRQKPWFEPDRFLLRFEMQIHHLFQVHTQILYWTYFSPSQNHRTYTCTHQNDAQNLDFLFLSAPRMIPSANRFLMPAI